MSSERAAAAVSWEDAWLGLPASSKQAIESGLTRYFTGKACKHGHVAPRNANKGTCTVCMQKASAAWKSANPLARLGQQQRWRAKHPDYYRDWYVSHAEKRRADARKYKRDNPEMRRKYEVARRARENNAEGFYDVEDIARIKKAQRNRCACCRKASKLTIDHIVALANGGSNWPRNIQMLCKSCNSKKSSRDNEEFMRSFGALL